MYKPRKCNIFWRARVYYAYNLVIAELWAAGDVSKSWLTVGQWRNGRSSASVGTMDSDRPTALCVATQFVVILIITHCANRLPSKTCLRTLTNFLMNNKIPNDVSSQAPPSTGRWTTAPFDTVRQNENMSERDKFLSKAPRITPNDWNGAKLLPNSNYINA